MSEDCDQLWYVINEDASVPVVLCLSANCCYLVNIQVSQYVQDSGIESPWLSFSAPWLIWGNFREESWRTPERLQTERHNKFGHHLFCNLYQFVHIWCIFLQLDSLWSMQSYIDHMDTNNSMVSYSVVFYCTISGFCLPFHRFYRPCCI